MPRGRRRNAHAGTSSRRLRSAPDIERVRDEVAALGVGSHCRGVPREACTAGLLAADPQSSRCPRAHRAHRPSSPQRPRCSQAFAPRWVPVPSLPNRPPEPGVQTRPARSSTWLKVIVAPSSPHMPRRCSTGCQEQSPRPARGSPQPQRAAATSREPFLRPPSIHIRERPHRIRRRTPSMRRVARGSVDFAYVGSFFALVAHFFRLFDVS